MRFEWSQNHLGLLLLEIHFDTNIMITHWSLNNEVIGSYLIAVFASIINQTFNTTDEAQINWMSTSCYHSQ